jgi:DNA-binding MarR family transcriptional regulator
VSNDTPFEAKERHEGRRRALLLIMRYSLELTGVIEQIAKVGTSGNNELRVLTHLFTSGPSDRQTLIALTGMSRSGAAQLVDRLEDVGLVTTRRGSTDHRTAVSELTPAGHRRIRAMERELGSYFSAPNPLVKELLDLLAPITSSDGQPISSTTPLAALEQLASFGAQLGQRVDVEIGVSETRQRLTLATLADWGDARPGQLADVLGLTSGGTTYLVDQLDSAGLVDRRYGTVSSDRRAVVIQLSPRGRVASERFADIIFEHADELADVLRSVHAPR